MNIRPVREGDVNFILSTWLKSYYDAVKYYGSKGCPFPVDDIFFHGHQEKIKLFLKGIDSSKNGAKCLVCVAPDDESQIIGYIVFDKDSLHYCYVKNVYRKLGAAKALRSKSTTAKLFTHFTRYSQYINQGLIYDPYKF